MTGVKKETLDSYAWSEQDLLRYEQEMKSEMDAEAILNIVNLRMARYLDYYDCSRLWRIGVFTN